MIAQASNKQNFAQEIWTALLLGPVPKNKSRCLSFSITRLLFFLNGNTLSEMKCYTGKTKNVHEIKSLALYNNILQMIPFI